MSGQGVCAVGACAAVPQFLEFFEFQNHGTNAASKAAGKKLQRISVQANRRTNCALNRRRWSIAIGHAFGGDRVCNSGWGVPSLQLGLEDVKLVRSIENSLRPHVSAAAARRENIAHGPGLCNYILE